MSVGADLPARHTGRLPNQTTVMLVFDRAGAPLLEYTYGLRQNLRQLPPEVRQY